MVYLISKSTKAIFIIINHVAAVHVPRVAIPPNIHGRDNSDVGKMWDVGSAEIKALMATGWGKTIDIWAYKEACDCKECAKDEINDDKDCQKCNKCPAGKTPSPEKDKCVDDDCKKDCAANEVNDEADCKKCKACPAGKKPDPTKKTCVDENDNCKKDCAVTEINDEADCSKCKACPPGKKPDPAKKTCVDIDDKCKKDCAANEINDEADCSKCKACPAGKKPDPAKKTCVDENDDKCKKDCAATEINDEADCSKCKSCPSGKKPDATKKTCVADDDKKNKKKDKFEETKNRQRKTYRSTKKKGNFEKAKPKYKNTYQTHKKRTRMGRCLTLVPLGMTAVAGDDFAWSNEFFDEDLIGDPFMDQFWPGDMPDAPDTDIFNEKYLEQYMKAVHDNDFVPHGGGGGGNKVIRDIEAPHQDGALEVVSLAPLPSTDIRERSPEVTTGDMAPYEPGIVPRDPSTETGLAIRNTDVAWHMHDKRFIQFIIEAIIAFVGLMVRLLPRILSVAGRLARLAEKGGVKIAKAGKSKASRKDQEGAADKVAKNKNWKNCLKGIDPVSLAP